MHLPASGCKARLAWLVLALLTTLSSVAGADIIRAFDTRASFDQRGDIQLVGNTLLTCTGSGCAAIQNGTDTGGNAHNGNRNMVYVNVDAMAGFPNSSSADLVLPPGATVQFAGLYWGARAAQTSTTRGDIRFRVPGTPGYHEINAEVVDTVPNQWTNASSHPYQAMADVTALVAAAGSGTYTVADLTANSGNGGTLGNYGGWGLVVIYQDSSQPFRRLMVYDGAAEVDNSNDVNITVEGLLTPLTGAFSTYLGALVWEGDLSYSGDQFRLNGTTLSDALNPANNFWNSTITRLGQHITSKNPHYVNQLAVDLNYVDASGILANGADSATLTFSTNMDAYAPHAVAFVVELHAPDLITSLDIDGVDVNGGLLLPGDEIEYTIAFSNTGADDATNVLLEAPLPAGVTFVPDSLEIITNASGAPVGQQTDAVGDDLAEFDGNSVIFRAGTGASASQGGVMPVGESASLRFRVQVDNTPAVVGETLSSDVFVTYNSATLGTEYNASGSVTLNLSVASETEIEDELELILLDITAGTPTSVTVGGQLTYTFTVANSGNLSISNLGLDIDLPVTGISCTDTSLAPSAQTTCQATVTLTQDMLDNEEVSFNASATATGPTGTFSSGTVSETTPLDMPPELVSIARFAPVDALTNVDPVGFLVTFSKNVTNVDASDFLPVGSAAGSASILSVATQGGAHSYLVTVTGIAEANGTLGLALSPTHDIEDSAGATLVDLAPTGINQTYTLDNTPPPVPVVSGISEDTGISDSDGITQDNTLLFHGTGEADSLINVYLDGTPLGTALVDSNGLWTFDHSGTTLPDGTYAITATAEDSLGNTSAPSAALTVVVDTEAPVPTLDQDGAELNDSTPTLTGTTEPGATVVVEVDGETYTTTADATTGQWTVTVTEELADGQHPVEITITDLAGNSDSDSFTLSIDGEPPVVESIQRHTPTEEITSADTVTFLVSFDEEVFGVDATDFVLTGTAATGAIISNLTPQAGGTQYLVEISGIDNADGALGLAISATADILDSHGNALTPAVPPVNEGYVLDNTAPALDVAVIEDDTLTLHFDETLDNTSVPSAGDFTVLVDGDPITVTGVSVVDDTVVLTLEDGISSNASVTVSYTPGSNPIVDLAGNPADSFSGEPVTNDTEDNVPPRLDNITRHDPVDALTNASSVTFLVTFDEDVTNVTIGSFEATGAGATTATIDNVTALSGNSYTVTVGGIDEANGELGLMLSSMQSIEDLAGNLLVDPSVLGNSETYTLDNTPPAVPAITGISEDTGISDNDGITSDNTLVFHGTGEPDSLITVYLDDVAIGTVVVNGDDNWSLDHTATALTDGTYTVTATAEDELGNTSELSDEFTVVIVTQVDEPTLDQDGSTLENGTLTGTTSPHGEVCVAINSEEIACVTADENGDWTLDLNELGVGTHDLDITVTDPAGNEESGSFTVTVGTPPTPIITGISADTGVSNSDGITSDHTPTIHGTAQAGHTVDVYLDGIQIGTALVDLDGQWSLPHSGQPLDDGSYLITAIAEDLLGNVSLLSLPFALTIDMDTSVPTLHQDGETHDATPTLTGDAEPGAEITVTLGGETWTTTADSNGHWSVELVDGLPNGDYDVIVEATDTAGNTASGDYTLSIDEALTVLRRVERDDPQQRETNASEVHFLLVFSAPVAGVDATDLIPDGPVASDALITSVTPLGINGDGEAEYRVTLTVFNQPDGELGLALAMDHSIIDQYGNDLGQTTPGVNQRYLLDNLAPELVEASVTGNSLLLTYDEPLSETALPDTSDFTVTVDGTTVPVTSISVSGTGVTLTLGVPVAPGAAVQLAYTPGSTPVSDLAGNGAAALSDVAVINQSLREIETGLRGVGSGSLALLLLLGLGGALRRSRLALLIAVSLLSSQVLANDHYPYVGGGIGQSRLKPDTDNTGYRVDDKTDTALDLFIGYQWHPHWSAELSWHDLGAAELEPTLPGLDPIDVDYRFLGLSGIGYLKGFDWDARGWDLFGRLGLGTLDTSGNGGVSVDQDKDWQVFFGAGVEYRFARGWATRLQATSFDKDAAVVTLDLLKRFGRRPAPPAPPQDSDGDGVIDELDQCPDTPAGVQVDEVGCPIDSDGDGVPDYLDQCPNTPRGVKVDDTGCPLDSDGDGVPDYRDACPGTPPGAVVDEQGCEEAFALEVRNILFATNSAALTERGMAAVARVAEYLGQSDTRLRIVAHTDSQGAAAYNQQLSERRAASVMEALIAQGVDPTRLESQGRGEEEPIADNSTVEGRQQNRRVEFIVLEDGVLENGE